MLEEVGQSFLEIAEDVLLNPADQDVASALFNSLGRYFAKLRRAEGLRELHEIEAVVERMLNEEAGLQAVTEAVPDLEQELRAMLTLAHVSEYLLNPIFGQTDAVGTVMNEKIEPVTVPLRKHIFRLRGRDPEEAEQGRGRRRRRNRA